MSRGAVVVCASLLLHGAALIAITGDAATVPLERPRLPAHESPPLALLLEGATVAPGSPAFDDPLGTRRATDEAGDDSPQPRAPHEAHRASPRTRPRGYTGRATVSASAGSTAAGAPSSIFGTATLRSFLLALSADTSELRDARARYILRFDDGGVRVEPRDASGERMARTLATLLEHARMGGSPPLAGALAITLDERDDGDGAFTIRCDERARTGSVGFPSGRRATVREGR